MAWRSSSEGEKQRRRYEQTILSAIRPHPLCSTRAEAPVGHLSPAALQYMLLQTACLGKLPAP